MIERLFLLHLVYNKVWVKQKKEYENVNNNYGSKRYSDTLLYFSHDYKKYSTIVNNINANLQTYTLSHLTRMSEEIHVFSKISNKMYSHW